MLDLPLRTLTGGSRSAEGRQPSDSLITEYLGAANVEALHSIPLGIQALPPSHPSKLPLQNRGATADTLEYPL